MRFKDYLMLGLCLLFVISIVLYSYITLQEGVWYHEKVHKRIFLHKDINSTIQLNGLSGLTTPINSSSVKLSDEEHRFMDLSNEFNDAVSYNLYAVERLLAMILIFCSVIIVLLFIK